MLALALVAFASAAEPDLGQLATALTAVEERVDRPILVATTDPTMVSKLHALEADHEDLTMVAALLDGRGETDAQMKRAMSRRSMRCGVYVDQQAGEWTVTEFGRCGTPAAIPEITPAPRAQPAPAGPETTASR